MDAGIIVVLVVSQLGVPPDLFSELSHLEVLDPCHHLRDVENVDALDDAHRFYQVE